MLARTRNDAVTGDELHRRFVDAAYGTDEGGGFVEYAWRNDADAPLKRAAPRRRLFLQCATRGEGGGAAAAAAVSGHGEAAADR